jgi:HD-GYP domain-containing protein (c-di-GMP phosphodiesterase class II)
LVLHISGRVGVDVAAVSEWLFRADPGAADGCWIEQTRDRRPRGLAPRDLKFSLVAASGFVVFAVLSAVFIPSSVAASPAVFATIVGTYALAATVEFEVGPGSAVPTELILVPMLFAVPLGLAPACVAGGLVLADLHRYARREAHPQRTLVLLVSAWHVAGPVIVLAAFGETTPALSHWPVYVLALLSQFAIDFVVTTLRAWYAFGTSPAAQLGAMSSVWAVDVALAPVGLLIALAAADYRLIYLTCVPLILLMAIFGRERKVRIDNSLELGRAYRGTALLLGDMIEADDQGTGVHSRDVVSLTVEVAERMGLGERDRRNAEFVALLHDVGKVHVPKEIINKCGPLTDLEWLVVRQHTVWGEEMLKAVGGILGEVGVIVRSCHERYDGDGYPDGLKGESIPLVARIIFACDAFSAMTTDRSYRRARPLAEAIMELRRNSGIQFDPEIVKTLAAIVEEDRSRPTRLRLLPRDGRPALPRISSAS